MKHVLFFISIFICINLSGQNKRGNIWYFGTKAGLDFNNAIFPPTPMNDGKMITGEGCASIADENGQLLFYTDGTRIWNKAHNLMPNANSTTNWNRMLSGDPSSAHSAVITPVLGSSSRYYVFTTDGYTANNSKGPKGRFDGLYYTIVDMTKRNGKGDIDTAFIHSMGYIDNKIPLVDSLSEKIGVAMHANGVDYWIIVQKNYTGQFYSFKVNCLGVDSSPIISETNPLLFSAFVSGRGLAVSYDGKCIATSGRSLILCDFNNNTGIVSNIKTISGSTSVFYGMCFSPNDSILYGGSFAGKIYRYQRFAPDITSTELVISASLDISIGALQVGPDNRIYIADYSGADTLHVIHTPNDFNNPNYEEDVVPLAGGTSSQFGLPNFFNFFALKDNNHPSFAQDDITICVNESVKIGQDSTWSWNYEWTPIIGLDNPNSPNPIASPDTTTTYIVKVILPCDTLFDTITITVQSLPLIIVGTDTIYTFKDTSICLSNQVELGSSNQVGLSYLWSSGIGLNDTTISNPIAKPSDSTLYILTISNGQCFNLYTQVVNVYQLTSANAGNDTTICLGDSIKLSGSGGHSYQWNTSPTLNDVAINNPIASPRETITYHLIVTDTILGCSGSDSVIIEVQNKPTFNILGDSFLCDGTILLSTPDIFTNYEWSTGENMSSITVNDTGKYWLSIEDDLCIKTDTIYINPCPNIYIPNVFSPNNDGKNDVFNIRGVGIKEIVIRVYNRWGNKVFESTDINKGWDGKEVGEGVYVYQAYIDFVNNQQKMLKGNITIIR